MLFPYQLVRIRDWPRLLSQIARATWHGGCWRVKTSWADLLGLRADHRIHGDFIPASSRVDGALQKEGHVMDDDCAMPVF